MIRDIRHIDHTVAANARAIHAVQMLAYAQEAALLGAVYFPPLHRTFQDIQSMNEQFHGAYIDEELAGAVSTCHDDDDEGINVSSLVVSPAHQRNGIAAALMATVLSHHGSGIVTVQTGAKNIPALSLYTRLGFVEIRRWFVGREPLELVKLSRAPDASFNAVQEQS